MKSAIPVALNILHCLLYYRLIVQHPDDKIQGQKYMKG
jgi:hypothetical protein